METWSYMVDPRQRGFFLARKVRENSDNASSGDSETKNAQQGDTSNINWQIASLSEYENGFFKNVATEDRYFCFADPSNYEQAPGWMLRNLLVLIKQRWGIERVQLIRYRDVHARRDQGRSTVIQLESSSKQETETPRSLQSQGSLPLPKVTGWERNSTGKLAGRIVNLTEYMDPKRYGINLEITKLNEDLIKHANFITEDWQTSRLISTSNLSNGGSARRSILKKSRTRNVYC